MIDLRSCSMDVVRELCASYHGYSSAGRVAAYAFAVFEDGRPVAAYAWQPPAPGAALATCPEAPQGVLSLSRMVAVPNGRRAGEIAQRRLKHISKPLRRQMRTLIDRTRWPVLVTYSDEGQGHDGYVYRCSGWMPTHRDEAPFFLDVDGARVSRYSNGAIVKRAGVEGSTTIQRWEHWACERGAAATWMASHGWRRVPIVGRTWRSGRQAYRWTKSLPSSPPDGLRSDDLAPMTSAGLRS
jgi:hypothetical protein